MVDAGGATFGEICDQWVFDLIASIFGAYNPATGRREITEWFVLLPKKNGKSTIAAGAMMTALLLNGRPSAKFTILAPTVEIAGNSFDPSRDMCNENADEELAALMHVQQHIKTITHRDSNASLKVLAADSNTVGGAKSVGTLVDELWLFGSQPHAANMLREAIGGLASRPEGFVIYLTTQSDEPPAGVFKQKLDYARGVRDGRIKDPKFVPVIYEFPPDMVDAQEYRDVENFHLVNPNWGRSVDAEFIRREYSKAQEAGEEEVLGFLAKHGNVQIGLSLMADRWKGADQWEAAGRPLTLDEIIERSDIVVAGVDGGGLDDMLGLGVLGRCIETGAWLHWGKAWVHPIALERRKSEAARWKDFEASGDLVIVKQIGEDVAEVVADILRVHESGKLFRVGVDPVGIADIVKELHEAGVDTDAEGDDLVVGVKQGWALTGVIKTVERRLAEGRFLHCGSPLMAYAVGNAKVEPRGNAVLITKQASGVAKIDPLIALFNCASLLSTAPEPDVCSDIEVFSA